MGPLRPRGIRLVVSGMVCRFALMLDEGPLERGIRRRGLAAHLTCPACGGHHAVMLRNAGPTVFPWRDAERVEMPAVLPDPDLMDMSTHQCRDCGHRWAEALSPSL